jgi:hypothetical protein
MRLTVRNNKWEKWPKVYLTNVHAQNLTRPNLTMRIITPREQMQHPWDHEMAMVTKMRRPDLSPTEQDKVYQYFRLPWTLFTFVILPSKADKVVYTIWELYFFLGESGSLMTCKLPWNRQGLNLHNTTNGRDSLVAIVFGFLPNLYFIFHLACGNLQNLVRFGSRTTLVIIIDWQVWKLWSLSVPTTSAWRWKSSL